MVRQYTVESCINFAKKLSTSQIKDNLVPYIEECAKAESWRVRYLIAEKIIDLCKSFGKQIAMGELIGYYVKFLSDIESEVRTVAI